MPRGDENGPGTSFLFLMLGAIQRALSILRGVLQELGALGVGEWALPSPGTLCDRERTPGSSESSWPWWGGDTSPLPVPLGGAQAVMKSGVSLAVLPSPSPGF